MGADCDTFHGDSGGAVFLRNSSLCCGILVEGLPDASNVSLASFLYHEKIVPFTVIHERLLDKTMGLVGWPNTYHVNVISN
jgi:hypothetical protein